MESKNENSLSSTFSTESIDEVNYTVLIDSARTNANNKNPILGEHLLNLALISPNIDISSKMVALAIKSFIHLQANNHSIILNLAKKCLKMIIRQDIQSLDRNTVFGMIRILYRAGTALEDANQNFIALYLLFLAKNLFDVKKLFDEVESNNILREKIDKLSEKAEDEARLWQSRFNVIEDGEEGAKILNKVKYEELSDQLTELKSIFTQSDTNEDEEKYYLISTSWVRNMIQFCNVFNKSGDSRREYSAFINKSFDYRRIIDLMFADDKFNDLAPFGIYPGPINNFNITDYKDCWLDPAPSEAYSNIYITPGIKENSDFFYLRSNHWNSLKNFFGHTNEIERRCFHTEENNNFIEVYLRKLDVLVFAENIRKTHMNLIKPRKIQISKFSTIKNLKEKIVRCVDHEISLHEMEKQTKAKEADAENNAELSKNDNNDTTIASEHEISKEFKVKLYLINFGLKEKRNEVFQLIYSYANLSPFHTIVAEEIEDDALRIENLNYGPGDLLVCEIESNFIQLLKERKICAFCSNVIVDKIKCPSCTTVTYCSESCLKNDESHLSYHKSLNALYKKKFNLHDLFAIKIESLIEKGARHGLVGLKNLGNTCFMNSALQCLSNCEDLTKYFLLKNFIDEINKTNKHGSGGEIARAYYELLKELWLGESKYLCPSDFRYIFVKFVRQFAGFSQHDSHEMLTFMLDTLNEDLNRVKNKPYMAMEEKLSNESDEDASQRWWKNHLKRENSVIVDLFHGQYKSVITCPECNRISITYDPFMYLGLPIPSGHYKIFFKYFPYYKPCELNGKMLVYEYELPINQNTTIKDMKSKVLGSHPDTKYPSLEGVLLTKEKLFKKLMREDELIFDFFDNGTEICMYEKFPSCECDNSCSNFVNNVTFLIYPAEFVEERSYMFMKSINQRILSYPIAISLNPDEKVQDILLKTFIHIRKILIDANKTFTYNKFLENYSKVDYSYITREFEISFPHDEDKHPFKLHLINNVPESVGIFSSKQNCEFCGNKCEHCKLLNGQIKLSDSIGFLQSRQRVQRPFVLYAEILKLRKNAYVYDNMEMPLAPKSKNLIYKQASISIYDCLNLFRSEERLEKENAWYCEKCKKHQEAFKKLDIYSPPHYLIVQFKRFKIKTNSTVMGIISNKKNDTLISYPELELDLREYVLGSSKNEAIYDLYAISQHFGGLNSGHYTALCQNLGKWYEYDDDCVSVAENTDIVNPAAYLLFYKKRSITNNINK